eukprot:COSAG01_NODE_1_length_100484_cov_170.446142_4_plen_472_part_00
MNVMQQDKLVPKTKQQAQIKASLLQLIAHSQDSSQTEIVLQQCCEKLQAKDTNPEALWQFLDLYTRAKQSLFQDQKQQSLKHMQALNPDQLPKLAGLGQVFEKLGQDNISKLANIKLNGGLGTSMGCEGPKSLIEVWQGQSFLELMIKQQHTLNKQFNSDSPLLLMNSIFTAQACEEKLAKQTQIQCFEQHLFPRIDAKSWGPINCQNSLAAYYPPGHGDIYGALLQSGYLDKLINQGCDYAFISNSDNLAAVPDPKILGYMLQEKLDFLMEVTPKTVLDVKGGALVKNLEKNKIKLLERAEVLDSELDLFEDIATFKLFNTNNLWVNLHRLKEKMSEGLSLPVILNKKCIENQAIIQLETAMGSAIEVFEKSAAMVVSRDRFMPVKKTSDLFLLQSDLMIKDSQTGMLSRNPAYKKEQLPAITFCKAYEKMSHYQKWVKSIPSLLSLNSLTLTKEVLIDESQHFSGDIEI